jgi:hypothetical protein
MSNGKGGRHLPVQLYLESHVGTRTGETLVQALVHQGKEQKELL